jgi:hypothetical protein
MSGVRVSFWRPRTAEATFDRGTGIPARIDREHLAALEASHCDGNDPIVDHAYAQRVSLMSGVADFCPGGLARRAPGKTGSNGAQPT